MLSVRAEDVPKLLITVCRNGACNTGTPALPDGSAGLLACNLQGPLDTVCTIAESPTGVAFNLEVNAGFGDLQNGDHYTLTIALPSAPPVVAVDRTVTYDGVQPNGQGCDPTCKQASLD
jgi:hypothetical protein